jgi:hypothetical protein
MITYLLRKHLARKSKAEHACRKKNTAVFDQSFHGVILLNH